MNRRQVLRLLGLGTVGVAVGIPGYAWAQAHSFQINTHPFKLERLQAPVRVAHLSDLHFGRWHGAEHVRDWVNATLKQRPDLIVLTGDTVDGTTHPDQLEALAAELERLEAALGVYAVLGNHDYGSSGSNWRTQTLIEALERVGVKYLVNEGVSLRPDLYLSGVDDYWFGEVNSARATRDATDAQAILMLCHNPDVLPKLSTRIGLTLSGHTHGGQIIVPGVGNISAIAATLYRLLPKRTRNQIPALRACHRVVKNWEWSKGLYQVGTNALYVNRGLGTYLPGRLFCPPEVTVLKLVSA
ncbi:MAG: metallophosphoesterase [Pleurocapsa sp. SU_196_0]|nr:metallophosphoesterase [Pleurocapsa sp. SU_196_0]